MRKLLLAVITVPAPDCKVIFRTTVDADAGLEMVVVSAGDEKYCTVKLDTFLTMVASIP